MHTTTAISGTTRTKTSTSVTTCPPTRDLTSMEGPKICKSPKELLSIETLSRGLAALNLRERLLFRDTTLQRDSGGSLDQERGSKGQKRSSSGQDSNSTVLRCLTRARSSHSTSLMRPTMDPLSPTMGQLSHSMGPIRWRKWHLVRKSRSFKSAHSSTPLWPN